MRHFILVAVFMMITAPVFAADAIRVNVKGMVCDFCAQSVTKVFLKNEAVKDVSVDLDTQTITLDLNNGANLSDEEVKDGVHYSGYDFVSLERMNGDE